MKYYIIYRSEDIDWYQSKDTLLGVTENEDIAKDFCNKFRGIYYEEAEVGKDFKTGKSRIPRMKKDKLEMLYKFDKAANNFGDVSIIDPNKLPDFDYMTYSFPCTDISVSGKQEGIERGQTRSGLLYECEKIIEVSRRERLYFCAPRCHP